MSSSLRDLIAPLDESGFRDLLRARSLMFRRSTGETRFSGLLDWDVLRGVIESGAFPCEKLRVTSKGLSVLPRIYVEMGKVNAVNLAKLLDRGASLIAEPLDAYVPALDTLCKDIRVRIAEKIYAGAIATTGSGGAIKLHYDPEDLIILHLEGSKRWKIHGPPVAAPVGGMPEQPPPQGEPLFDEILRPGDFLFVPAGYWHHCENGPGRSLHVGIFIEPPTGWHAVKGLLPQILAEEIVRVPLTRFDDAAQRAAHEAALKAHLIEKIQQTSVSEMLAEGEKAKASAKPNRY